jgi:dTDP-4-amino-4,6-dideoxygalactose transaminase
MSIAAQAPAGRPLSPRQLLEVLRDPDPEQHLRRGLEALLGTGSISLHHSGREALRIALERAMHATGRDEVLVPAYTCFSVPAAAVAAGARVRAVDVDADGRPHFAALPAEAWSSAAAVVVDNLFGHACPVAPVHAAAQPHGVWIIDDAAQSLGCVTDEGALGTRGHLGILSFGRGKPLSALGGGAILWTGAPLDLAARSARPARWSGIVQALAFNAALWPAVFGVLRRVPALAIGETLFDPAFERGEIDGAALSLAAAQIEALAARTAERRGCALQLAQVLEEHGAYRPLRKDPDGVFPRLAVVAASQEARDAALEHLGPLGASRSYPSAITEIPGLQPRRVGSDECPGARSLARRIFTLATHGRTTPAQLRTALASMS